MIWLSPDSCYLLSASLLRESVVVSTASGQTETQFLLARRQEPTRRNWEASAPWPALPAPGMRQAQRGPKVATKSAKPHQFGNSSRKRRSFPKGPVGTF